MPRADDPFDTYLLRVLCTLLAERSVSRTAIRLNQSQPAISTALKRLREIAGDPLLVRDRGQMVPTPRALELQGSAERVLAEVERMTRPPEAFEAATGQHTFRIGSPDFLSVAFLSRLVQDVRRQAPGCRLHVQPLGPDFDHELALAQGRLDLVIGNWPLPPEQLHLAVLLEDEIVCLVAREHRLARGMSSADYLAAPHIVPLPYSPAHRGVVESHLATLRVKRQATVMLPSFHAAPYLLPGTDLVFTTSRHFARHFAALLPLAIVPAPMDFPRMRFYQLWHDRAHHEPAHKWLRARLAAASAALREAADAGA